MKTESSTGRIRIILSACIMLVCLLIVSAACAEDWQAEAKRMLKMINEFRTGDDAWYWNQSNTQKIYATGLKPLVYDLELEKVAQTRAAELAISLSHTRPDGSRFSTAYPAGNYAKAENIGAGFRTAEGVFEGFLEEYENYAGQGHRRNMLRSNITRVGLAAVEVNGTVYWVQEFASGAARSPVTDAGWVRDGSTYSYVLEDGSRATGWLQDQGAWYYLNENGIMQTGWQKIGGQWYYLDNSGAMKTGWQKLNGNWYYFASDGVMRTGWQKNNSKWYYLNTDGVMLDGWQKLNGKWYYLGTDGIMQTGWQKIDKKWYHFNSSGVMHTGWQEIDGAWYYFKDHGEMVTGRVAINGVTEVFTSDGVWQHTEINEYETPLGIFSWRSIIMLVRQILQTLFSYPV